MGYVGNAPAEKYTTIDKQTLTGNSTVGPYTLTHSVGNEQEIEVFVNNVRQEPGVSYTVSSNQLTMSASVDSADDFYVIFQGKAKMTATHPPTFDLTAANGTFTGTVTTGGLTVGSDTAKTKFYSDSTYNGIYNGSALTNNESIYMGSGTLFFYSGGGERMRISSSGNLLVGTTSTIDGARITSVASGSVSLGLNGSGGAAMIVRHPAANQIDFTTTATNSFFTFSSNTVERMRIDSSGFVGIGESAPQKMLHITRNDSDGIIVLDANGTTTDHQICFSKDYGTGGTTGGNYWGIGVDGSENKLVFAYDPNAQASLSVDAKVVLDSSGNLLVAKTAANFATAGTTFYGGSFAGLIHSARDSNVVLNLNRLTNDGEIVAFNKDGTTVGTIGVAAGDNLYIGGTATNHAGVYFGTRIVYPLEAGSFSNGNVDLGHPTVARFRDLYLSGGVYLGGTGSANYLDDYEEGTWTPTAVQGVTGFTISSAGYTKVGRLVTVNFYLNSFTGGDGNRLEIGGLPFTSKASTYYTAIFEVNDEQHAQGRIGTNAAKILFWDVGSDTRASYTGNTLTSHLIGSITYEAA